VGCALGCPIEEAVSKGTGCFVRDADMHRTQMEGGGRLLGAGPPKSSA
jgi:hypothetical protein